MKIISWNLNHRTLEKPIPSDTLRFFIEAKADLICLNEYVDGPSRRSFEAALNDAGFTHQFLSPRLGNNNQIFIAAKLPVFLGDLKAPDLTDAAITNFLHIRLADSSIEIVGLRAPAYKLASERQAYWAQLGAIMRAASSRNIIFVGDFNYDPFPGAARGAAAIDFNLGGNFSIPNPSGAWSFMSIDGQNTSRIDHVLVARGLCAESVRYLTEFNGIRLAGSKNTAAITDHAALVFDLDYAHCPHPVLEPA